MRAPQSSPRRRRRRARHAADATKTNAAPLAAEEPLLQEVVRRKVDRGVRRDAEQRRREAFVERRGALGRDDAAHGVGGAFGGVRMESPCRRRCVVRNVCLFGLPAAAAAAHRLGAVCPSARPSELPSNRLVIIAKPLSPSPPSGHGSPPYACPGSARRRRTTSSGCVSAVAVMPASAPASRRLPTGSSPVAASASARL